MIEENKKSSLYNKIIVTAARSVGIYWLTPLALVRFGKYGNYEDTGRGHGDFVPHMLK